MQWPRLDELDDKTVTSAYEYVTQLMRERHPDADTQRGMLGSFVGGLHAILHGAVRTVLQRMRQSLSFRDVAASPHIADPELVDDRLANVGMVRKLVTKARGNITCVLGRPVAVAIIRGESFRTDDGQFFLADNDSIFKADDVPLQHNEQHLQRIGDTYVFTIAVTARDEGGVVPRSGQSIMPQIAPPGLIRAYASSDFRGSFVLQNNADVLRALRNGITAPGYSNRDSIEALIMKADPEQYRFAADIQALNVVGAYDPEGQPGQIYIYVRGKAGVDIANLCKELRDYLYEPNRICLTAQVSVRQPTTYYVSVNIKADNVPSNTLAIQRAVVESIAACGFTNRLHTSMLIPAIIQAAPNIRIKEVSFDFINEKGVQQIELSEDISAGCTRNTMTFAADIENVRFSS